MADYKTIASGPDLRLNDAGEEISLEQGDPSPIKLYVDEMEENPFLFARDHWHDTVQFSIVIKGSVDFCVGDGFHRLVKGEGIMINSNVLHHMQSSRPGGSATFSVQMSPTAISGGNHFALHAKYVAPVVANGGFPCIAFKRDSAWTRRVLRLMHEIMAATIAKETGYELAVKNSLLSIWLTLIQNNPDILDAREQSKGIDDKRVKQMLEYIHAEYRERVVLSAIAASANISEGECCRCFRRFLKTTPFQYLMRYRTEMAAKMLTNTELPIGAIAYKTGFSDVSYFHRVFKKNAGMTPRRYRELYYGNEATELFSNA